MPTGLPDAALDRRFMAAAIRYSARNAGLTATNPSVGTLIVRFDVDGPRIVGRGVTAHGVTSLADLGIQVSMADVDVALKQSFKKIFG